jgi:2-polyprenyl-3-methyl-5-hydroxy-6-metoxy-1,4-benzoquinol methylase
MDVKEIDILGNDIVSHWYYQSKASALSQLLSKKIGHNILDVGAGSGFFSRFLLQNTEAKKSVCVDSAYLTDHVEEINGKQIYFVKSIDSSDADTILMTDVLEHISDDTAFLRSYAEKTKKSSRFLFSVPAFQFLWSGHDVFLGHYRRYTLQQLENTVRKSGLIPIFGCYYFANVFPIACAMRLLTFHRHEIKSSLQRHSSLVNGILKLLCRTEQLYMRWNHFVGLTACCIAEHSTVPATE